MWKLTSKKTGDEYYMLVEKTKYEVGRSGSDINITGDNTISRSHARLYPCENHIILIDTASKFGVFCNHNIENNIKIDANIKNYLRNGERVQFGIKGNEFIVSKVNLVTMISSVDDTGKSALMACLEPLKVQTISTCQSNCTHLTMSKLTITVKVIHALIDHIPIVSCEFWKIFLSNIRNGEGPPKPEEYLPPITEDYLLKNSSKFLFNEKRRTIFAGKTFVFVNRAQYNTYSPIITKAGGHVHDVQNKITTSILDKDDIVVVLYISSTQSQNSQSLDYLQEYLTKTSRRLIPEYEIGMAVLYCSIETYCNPRRKPMLEMLPNSTHVLDIPESILVEETPSIKTTTNTMTSYEIPESNDSVDFAGQQSKIQSKWDILTTSDMPSEISEFDVNSGSEHVSMKRKAVCENNKPAKKANLDSEKLQDTEPFIPRRRTTRNNPAPPQKKTIDTLTVNSLNLEVDIHSTEPPSMQTVPIKPAKTYINKLDFLDKKAIAVKSQAVLSEVVSVDLGFEKSANQSNASLILEKPKKRKLKIISDADENSENEDDLFNFGRRGKKTKQTINLDAEDPFLNFSKSSASSSQSNQAKSDSVNDSAPRIVTPLKKLKQVRVDKRMDIPKEGWLSSDISKLSIKKEETCNDMKEEDITNSSIYQWIDSIKNGFHVRTKAMNLSSRSKDSTSATILDTTTASVSSGKENGKNFKAFVKRQNFPKQTLVIRTTPVQLYNTSNAF